MAEPRWALIDHRYLDEYLWPEGEGFFLIATTDTPCHLWARVSKNFPDKHYITLIRRGLATYKATYRCFNTYGDIEQLEPGDTLVHKFHLKNPPYQKPIYFFYWGEVGAVESPSHTCIFALTSTYHRGLLYEMYNPAAYQVLTFTYYRPQAQTFIAPATFDITAVRLRSQFYNTGHRVTVDIRTTLADGSPSSYIIASTTYPNMPPDWSTAGLDDWHLTLPRARIKKWQRIAICLWGDPDFPNEWQGIWGRDGHGDIYPGGKSWNGYFDPPNGYWKSCPYPGGPWFDEYDQRFAVYGVPPLF